MPIAMTEAIFQSAPALVDERTHFLEDALSVLWMEAHDPEIFIFKHLPGGEAHDP